MVFFLSVGMKYEFGGDKFWSDESNDACSRFISPQQGHAHWNSKYIQTKLNTLSDTLEIRKWERKLVDVRHALTNAM